MISAHATYQWRSRRWRMLSDGTPSAGAASGDGHARAEVLRIAGAHARGCSETRRLIGGERGRALTDRWRLGGLRKLSDVAHSAGGDVGGAHTHAEAAYHESMPKLMSAQDGVGMT